MVQCLIELPGCRPFMTGKAELAEEKPMVETKQHSHPYVPGSMPSLEGETAELLEAQCLEI